MRFLRLLLSPLVAMAATACDNAVKITYQGQFSPYSRGLIAELARDGELPLRLYGAPLADSADGREIAAAIRPPSWLPRGTHFTTTPTTVTRNFAVVLVFNPAFRESGMDSVCTPGNAPQTIPGDSKTLRVAANVCLEGKSISWLYAEGPAPKALGDANFRKLTDQIVIKLFPEWSPSD
ncbi:MAG TPA: hypothetical protein VGO34_11785 [Alphaproteobacteria bacterium]